MTGHNQRRNNGTTIGGVAIASLKSINAKDFNLKIGMSERKTGN